MKTSDVIVYFGVWSILMTALWVVVAVTLWMSRRGSVNHEHLRESSHKAHCRIDDLKERCVTVEARINTVPTHADLNKVVEAVARIGGDVRNMQGQIGGISNAMLRMEKSLDVLTEHHIKEGTQ